MTFAELRDWVKKQGQFHWINARALESKPNEMNGGTVDLMWRQDNMQVERMTHNPYDVIPMHRHPQVDSYEFPLWGSGEFWLNGRKLFLDDTTARWRPIFISRNTWHGGCGKERGGAFLSVQCWHMPINGSVLDNWTARP